MSLEIVGGETVHYPKRRDVFEFDHEVAKVFDSMAPRSIPMYYEAHRLHISLFEPLIKKGSVVVDIGSSTGHLFRSIENKHGDILPNLGITAVAVDSSQPMMDRLLTEFPYVNAVVGDIARLGDLEEQADIMFCLYTLQFVPPAEKTAALAWMIRNIKVGGVLVLGQKDQIGSHALRPIFDEEYYQFRRDNGYTQEEIDAKTAALKGSMWPIEFCHLSTLLTEYNLEFAETSRWLHFSTVACIRRK